MRFKPIPWLTMLCMYNGERQTSEKPALLHQQGWKASVKQVLTDPRKLDACSNLWEHSKISTNPEWFRKACCSSAGASLSWHGECWYSAEVLYWFVVPSYRSDLQKQSNRCVSSVQITSSYVGSYKLAHYSVSEVHLRKIPEYFIQCLNHCLVMLCAIKQLLYFSVVLGSENFQFCISL